MENRQTELTLSGGIVSKTIDGEDNVREVKIECQPFVRSLRWLNSFAESIHLVRSVCTLRREYFRDEKHGGDGD